jgi:hypothetical protein
MMRLRRKKTAKHIEETNGSQVDVVGFSFESLPQEVVLQIFSFLTTAEDLCSVSLICKEFHHIANDDQLWLPLCSPQWNVSPGGGKEAYLTWLRKAIAIYLQSESVSPTNTATPLRPAQPTSTGYDMSLTLLALGNYGAGKSSLTLRWTQNTFSGEPITGGDLEIKAKSKTINIGDKRVMVE